MASAMGASKSSGPSRHAARCGDPEVNLLPQGEKAQVSSRASLLRGVGDGLDLDLAIDDELAADGRAGRRRRAEILSIDAVEGREVARVLEEDGRLHDVAEPGAGERERRLDVLDHLFRLRL